MKRLLTIIAMLATVAFASCNNSDDGAKVRPTFTLTTSTIEIPQSGGAQQISFTIDNPSEWAQLRAVADVEWITDILWSAENNSVFFTVGENKTEETRTGNITITYDFKEYVVAISQRGIEFDNNWTVNPGMISLANYGQGNVEVVAIVQSEDGTYNGVTLDLYLPTPQNEICFDLPKGTASTANGTLGTQYSGLVFDVQADVPNVALIEEGTVELNDTGFVARIFDEFGKSYKIVYEGGRLHCDMFAEGQLTEDLNYNALQALGYYYGDDYKLLYTNAEAHFEVLLIGANGWRLSLDLICTRASNGTKIPNGTYPIKPLETSISGNTALATTYTGSNFLGSYLYQLNDKNEYATIIGLSDGTITISSDESGNQTVIVDAVEYHGELTISATYTNTGSIMVLDETSNVQQKSVAAPRERGLERVWNF